MFLHQIIYRCISCEHFSVDFEINLLEIHLLFFLSLVLYKFHGRKKLFFCCDWDVQSKNKLN